MANTSNIQANTQEAIHIALERRARRVWVSIVAGLLGLQVMGGVVAIWLATSDSSSAIIPGYYQSAVNWDVTRRARQLTHKLGWQLEHQVGPVDGDLVSRQLSVRVVDSRGEGVAGLSVSARVFHHAQGASIHQLGLRETTTGTYAGRTALVKSGVWQIDLRFEGEQGIAGDSCEVWVD